MSTDLRLALVSSLLLVVAGCSGNARESNATGTGTGGAGGSNPSGSTGGAGGSVTVIPGACDGLGAIDHFEDITPPGADLSNAGITSVQLDPVHPGTLFVGTDHRGLFKSTNCGATWSKVNTGKNAGILDSGTLWYTAIDWHDPNVLYAASLYGSDTMLYQSTNGGADWHSTMPQGSNVANTVDFFQEGSIDPTNHSHVVVSFHDKCKGMYPMCMAESHDSGATWRLLKGPTDGWTEDARPIVIDEQKWLYIAVEGGVYYTANSGDSWEKLAPGGGSRIYHAKDGTYYLSSLYGTWRSPDAHNWTSIMGSPNGCGIVGDGKRIFLGARYLDKDHPQGYFVSSEDDGNNWKPYPSPNMTTGSITLVYDSFHRVMYSANTSAGLFRIVTR
jgi:photosystem II stability/assembly factor-like uncharacterized protein